MAEPHIIKFTITDIGNPTIRADVPDIQLIRQPTEDDDLPDTFTPILKVTKTESTLTKGDKKLQKVTVSEVPPTYLNPNFSEVQSEVLPTQPVRDRIAAFNEGTKKVETKQKSKTRIPIKKFKESVSKISERRSSKDGEKDQPQVTTTTKKATRLSTPKLKLLPTNPEVHPSSADEEFDKIFEEIVDNKDYIDDVVINDTTIDDPVSLEYSFDEIAQAYDENKLEPIEITNDNVDKEETAAEVANLEKFIKTTKEIINDNDVITATEAKKPEKLQKVSKTKEVSVVNLVGGIHKGNKPHIEINRLNNANRIDTEKPIDNSKENKIDNIEANVNHSRIPLGRFKSVQEEKVPKNTIRRRSLKSAADDDVVKVKREDTEKVKVKKIVLDQNKSKNEKEAKAKHKELVRNILTTDSKNFAERKISDQPESPVTKSPVDDDRNEPNIDKTEENIIIEGDLVQYNKNDTSPDKNEDENVNIKDSDKIDNKDNDKKENDTKFSKVAETVKRVVAKLKPKDDKIEKPQKNTKENVIDEINSENSKLMNEKTSLRDTVVGDPKTEIIKDFENLEPEQSENSFETPKRASHHLKEDKPEDNDKDVKEPLHIYEKYTDLPRGFLAKEPEKVEVIKRKTYHQKELRLRKFASQFYDDVSYKDDKKFVEMTPVNTPIENKIAFDDMTKSSIFLVKNAVVKVKESDDQESEKSKPIEINSHSEPNYNNIEMAQVIENQTKDQKSNNHSEEKPQMANPFNKVKENGKENDTKIAENVKTKEKLDKNLEEEIIPNSIIKSPDVYEEISSNNRGKKNDKIKLKQEIPKKRSVLSKIAMFERNESTRNYHPQPKPPTADNNIDKKPKIVNEVLKTRIIREKSEKGEDILIKENIENTKTLPEDKIKVSVQINLESNQTVNTIEDSNINAVITVENEPIETEVEENKTKDSNLESNKTINKDEGIAIKIFENKQLKTEMKKIELNELNEDRKLEDTKVYKPKKDTTKRFEKKPIYKSVENLSKRYENMNSRSNDSLNKDEDKNINITESNAKNDRPRLYRAKSLADIELGEVLVGKVELVVKNIEISSEREREKKEVISVRERPRKRSVADKIAIFEKKIIDIEMDDAKPKAQNQNSITDDVEEKQRDREEEIRKRIDDLLTVKLRYKTVDNIPNVKLNDGSKMPVLALGTALLEPPLVKHVVCAAIDLGYRAIDTAFIYGNEKEVGEGIRAKIADGTVKREDLYIMSKLWSTFHRPDLVEKACNDTLAALGLEYLDLFMIHNPMSFKEGPDPIPKIANVIQYSEFEYIHAWHAMEDLVRNGLVRSIGVSNFNAEQIDRVLDKGRIKPAVNQVECQPYLSQHRLSAHCRSKAIALSCYGVLGSKGTPEDHKSAGSQPVIDDVNVRALAKDLGVTPARVLIRYQLEKGNAIVTKCSSSAHLKDILDALDMKLTQPEIDVLDGLNRNQRNFNFKGMGDTHRNYPFKKQF